MHPTRQTSAWLALAAMTLAVLTVGLDTTILNVALPTISAELGAGTSELQWIVNAYVLALAGAMLPAGVVGDRFGRKKTLLTGLGVFLLGSIGCALADSTNVLIAMRAAMGIGAAIIVPVTMGLLPLMFDDTDRPKAVGIMAAASSIGLPLGLLIGGYLLKTFAWHAVFWINVPVILVALAAVVALIGESRAPTAPRLDLIGAIAAAAGIVSLVYGIVEAPGKGWASAATLGYVAAGLAILAGFVLYQARTSDPLIDLSLFRNQRFVGGTVAVSLMLFVLYGLLFTLPQYLQAVRGNDAMGTGLRLIPMMAGLMVAAIASRRLLAKIGAGRGTVAGLLIIAASLALLAPIAVDTSMVWIGIVLTFFGAGMGVAMTSGMDAVLGSLPRTQAGAGSAVSSTLRQIAGALGVAILGSILSSIYRSDLDSSLLSQLPAGSAGTVRDSIVGANRVAASLGPAGEALKHSAAASYTDAMGVLLVISAVAGVAAAIVSGLVLRARTAPAATQAERHEPLTPITAD